MATHPPTDRVVAVLDRMACRPGRSFSLAELARDLDISKATLLAIVRSLTATGFLVRSPGSPSYTLGPSLVRLGSAAAGSRALAIDLSTPAAVELSREFGECVVSASTNGHISVLVRAVNGALDYSPVTREPPLAAPVGAVFMAWASPSELDDWLAHLDEAPDGQRRANMLGALEAVRRRGYSVALGVDSRTGLQRAVERATDAGRDLEAVRSEIVTLLRELDDHHYMVADLSDAQGYLLDNVAAPVRDSDGEVVVALTLKGFPRVVVSQGYVEAVGGRLLAAARSVGDLLASKGQTGRLLGAPQ